MDLMALLLPLLFAAGGVMSQPSPGEECGSARTASVGVLDSQNIQYFTNKNGPGIGALSTVGEYTGTWFRLEHDKWEYSNELYVSTCVAEADHDSFDTFIGIYQFNYDECADVSCGGCYDTDSNNIAYPRFIEIAYNDTQSWRDEYGYVQQCGRGKSAATVLLKTSALPHASVVFIFVGAYGDGISAYKAQNPTSSVDLYADIGLSTSPYLYTPLGQGRNAIDTCAQTDLYSCHENPLCKAVQTDSYEDRCVIRDLTVAEDINFRCDDYNTDSNTCVNTYPGYCTWQDGGSSTGSSCTYAPAICNAYAGKGTWCESYADVLYPSRRSTNMYVEERNKKDIALCTSRYNPTDFTSLLEEDYPLTHCDEPTHWNPELDTPQRMCDKLNCAANHHCAFQMYPDRKDRHGNAMIEPVCRCNNPAQQQVTGTECADSYTAPGAHNLITGSFSGDIKSEVDQRCGLFAYDAYANSVTDSWWNTYGCAAACVGAKDVTINATFHAGGGLTLSLTPAYAPSGEYDGRANWFAPHDRSTVEAIALDTMSSAQAQAFNEGKSIVMRYGIVPTRLDMYDNKNGENRYVSHDACAFHTTYARCEAAPGCSYCPSTLRCIGTQRLLPDHTNGMHPLTGEQIGEDVCRAPGRFNPSFSTEQMLPARGRPTTDNTGDQVHLCIVVQKSSGEGGVKIGIGMRHYAYASNYAPFPNMCEEEIFEEFRDGDLQAGESYCSTNGQWIDKTVRDNPVSSSADYFTNEDYKESSHEWGYVDTFASGTAICQGTCKIGGDATANGGGDGEDECAECPCVDMSADYHCGAGTSLGRNGCFDANCPSPSCAEELQNQFTMPVTIGGVQVNVLRFCQLGELQSCNVRGTSRFVLASSSSVGFECGKLPVDVDCHSPYSDYIDANLNAALSGETPPLVPPVLDAMCKIRTPLVLERALTVFPILISENVEELRKVFNVEAGSQLYVTLEYIPSRGRLLPIDCFDETCIREGNGAYTCLSTPQTTVSLAKSPNSPNSGSTVSCGLGIRPDETMQFVLDDTSPRWVFLVDEDVEAFTETMVWSVQGVHVGLTLQVNEAGTLDDTIDMSDRDGLFNPIGGPVDGDAPDNGFGNSGGDEDGNGDNGIGNILIVIAASVCGIIIIMLIARQIVMNNRKGAALVSNRSGTQELGTVDKAAASSAARSGTGGTVGTGTMAFGAAVNAGDKENLIDAKYIIKPKDLVKEAKIGEGGYGYVYRGEWRDMEVAIKEVRGTEPAVVEMLMLEARAAVDLRPHANIVTLYGVCLEPFSIVTAFCSKGSLDDMLYGDNPVEFSDAEVKALCVGIGSGISHLHHEGIIHRDLAARNILVNELGTPMVADFGMSRKDESAIEGAENQTKTTVGPIRWMAPEQLDAQLYSAASDVWSFGVILYEIFARQVPWKKYSNMKAAQLVLNEHHLAEERFRPENLNACVLVVMQSCFAYESADRPSMSWCVKKMTKEWSSASGGDRFVPKGKKAVAKPVRDPSDEGMYAAPPTRQKMSKKKSERRKEPKAGEEDGYTEPPEEMPFVAAAAGAPDSPISEDEAELEVAEGLYEAPKK